MSQQARGFGESTASNSRETEMKALIHSFGLTAGGHGGFSSWPPEVRAAVESCLSSLHPSAFFWGRDHLLIYNDAFRDILGIEHHPRALGRPAAKCWPEAWPILGPLLDGVFVSGRPSWSPDLRLPVRRGDILAETCVSLSLTAVSPAKGRIAGIACICIDNTAPILAERRHLERELTSVRVRTAREIAEVRRRYEELADSINIGIFRSMPWPEGSLLGANSTLRKLFGKTDETDLPGIDINKLYRDPGKREEIHRKLERNGSVKQEDIEFLDSAGNPFWAALSATRRRDENGVEYIEGILEEITERKKAEDTVRKIRSDLEMQVLQRTEELLETNRRLHRSGELLEKLFSHAHFLIAYLAADFSVIRVNPAFARADGRSTEFFTDRNLFALYPRGEFQADFRNAVTTGEPFTAYARHFPFPGERERTAFWDWNLQPVKDMDGRIEGLIFCLTDVTRRRRAELELGRAHKELAEARRLSDIGALAATIAHEVRNPLAAIKAAAYNIRRKSGPSLLGGHLDTIDKKVMESEQIIQNLLSYSRAGTPDYEPVKICEIAAECGVSIAHKYARLNIRFEHDCRCNADDVVEMDGVHLKMLFTNLLDNAFQALAEKQGAVRLTTECTMEGYFVFCVADDGVGIERSELRKVFEPFFTKKSRGIGLGLTLCRQITELYGGSIDIRSRKDRGTRVTVSLPLRRPLV